MLLHFAALSVVFGDVSLISFFFSSCEHTYSSGIGPEFRSRPLTLISRFKTKDLPYRNSKRWGLRGVDDHPTAALTAMMT